MLMGLIPALNGVRFCKIRLRSAITRFWPLEGQIRVVAGNGSIQYASAHVMGGGTFGTGCSFHFRQVFQHYTAQKKPLDPNLCPKL